MICSKKMASCSAVVIGMTLQQRSHPKNNTINESQQRYEMAIHRKFTKLLKVSNREKNVRWAQIAKVVP